jgi:CBS domain-containing protein
MLKAKDIMSKNIVCVHKDTPIFEAIQLLVEHNISGLPVVKDDMTLVGILSEKDVVDLFHEGEKAENKKVEDYMTEPAVHFDENSDIVNICNFLLKNIFRRIPVTSDGKIIGIISIKDILNSTLQQRQEKVGSPKK